MLLAAPGVKLPAAGVRYIPVQVRRLGCQYSFGECRFTDQPGAADKNHFFLKILDDLFLNVSCSHGGQIISVL